MKKKAYINPVLTIFKVEGEILMQVSGKHDTGSTGDVLTKENNSDWGDIWDE